MEGVLSLCDDLWRLDLCKYANRLSKGKWKPYPYLVHAAKIVQEAIRRGNGRIIINMPPRHGKSELFSHWLPVWYLDLFPTKRVLFTTHGNEFATKWGRRNRDEFISNELTVAKVRQDVSATQFWQLKAEGFMKSVGIGGQITGEGGDLMIIDDPHKDYAEACSSTIRQTVTDWYQNTFRNRAEPGATIILIQTRWHESDLAGFLLRDNIENWELVRFPAFAEDEDLLGRSEGDALCPDRYPEEALDIIKQASGEMGFAGLYQQRPSVLEGNVIKREWIRRWIEKELPNLTDHMQSWDLTFHKAGTSYVVGQVWGRNGANYYLLDQTRAKMSFTETIMAIRKMTVEWPQTNVKLVENKANGPAIIDTLKDSISGIIGIEPKGSKEARFSAVSPLFEAGNVWVPQDAPWVGGYIEAVVNFPNHSHDDEADSTSQALERYKKQIATIDYASLDFTPLGGKRSNPWTFDNANQS